MAQSSGGGSPRKPALGSECQQGAQRSGVRKILKRVASAAGLQIRDRVTTDRDPNALGTDGPGGVDVARCVADHDHTALRQRHPELLSAALGAQADHLRARLGVATKAAEPKM